MLLYGCAMRFAVMIPALLLSYVWVVVSGLWAVIIQLKVPEQESFVLLQAFFGALAAFIYYRLVGINVWVQQRRALA